MHADLGYADGMRDADEDILYLGKARAKEVARSLVTNTMFTESYKAGYTTRMGIKDEPVSNRRNRRAGAYRRPDYSSNHFLR